MQAMFRKAGQFVENRRQRSAAVPQDDTDTDTESSNTSADTAPVLDDVNALERVASGRCPNFKK